MCIRSTQNPESKRGPTKVEAGPFHDTHAKPYTAYNFCFTTKGKALYAIEMAWPMGGESVIHKINAVSPLGIPVELSFNPQADGLHINGPTEAPAKYAFVGFELWKIASINYSGELLNCPRT